MDYSMSQTDIPIKQLGTFPLSDVNVTDPYIKNAFDKMCSYLIAYQPDKLLAGFREVKGLPPRAPRYGGWEQTELRGHILGHYLKAVSYAYEQTNDKKYFAILVYMLDELKTAQLKNGYLSAFPEELFDRIESGGRAWAPWYTMHKIISGLIECYRCTESPTALQIINLLGDWVSRRTQSWTDTTRAVVLCTEYGGMNDAMYEVYSLTGHSRHLAAAHCFDELSLFASMKRLHRTWRAFNSITGKHANTMIPKFVGILNRYANLGCKEGFYFEACVEFWNEVVKNHSYITGGHSDQEHFGPLGKLDAGRSNCNNETCNVYNMLKLTRGLFRLTGRSEYMDFYERAYMNSILASQDPDTGMTTYFQAMQTGAFRIFATPFDKFWCCTGTGLESFTKLGDSIYFSDDDELYIVLPVSSELNWRKQGVRLSLENRILRYNTLTLSVSTDKKPTAFTVRLRKPAWIEPGYVLTVNGETVCAEEEDGYIILSRCWADKDVVALTMKPKLWYEVLPDSQNCAAFGFGPLVLCAGLGDEDKKVDYTGAHHDVEVATVEVEVPRSIGTYEAPEQWLHELDKHLLRKGDDLIFVLSGTNMDDQLVFTPYMTQCRQRYGLYWHLEETAHS